MSTELMYTKKKSLRMKCESLPFKTDDKKKKDLSFSFWFCIGGSSKCNKSRKSYSKKFWFNWLGVCLWMVFIRASPDDPTVKVHDLESLHYSLLFLGFGRGGGHNWPGPLFP